MFKKVILLIFIALVIFSAIYALSDKRSVTTSSEKAYQAFMQADALKNKLYTKDALIEYEKAIQLDTNFAMAYAELAWLHADMDRRDKAEELIAKALALSPNVTEKERMMIKVIEANISNNRDSLFIARQKYIEKFPKDTRSHIFLAEQYLRDHNYDAAIKEYEMIIDEDPGYALAYNMLGYLNYWNRNFDDALLYIKKYSMLAEKEANPHDSYGEILMYLGRYDEAIKAFETANKIKPDLVFVLIHLGEVYRIIGRYRDAVGYLERAKDNAQNKNQALSIEGDIAYTYHLEGKNEKALQIINEVLKEAPDHFRNLGMKGIILAGMGKIEQAEICVALLDSCSNEKANRYQNIEEKYQDSVFYSLIKAQVELEKGMFEDAIKGFQELVAKSNLPNLLCNRQHLGEAYLRSNNLEKAEEVFLSNLEDNPNSPSTLFSLSQVYNKQNRTEDQKAILLKYLSVMSGSDEDVAKVLTAREQLDSLSVAQPSM